MNNNISMITKPTLLLNEIIARSNIHAMADKASRSNVIFRPHFKTHQSIEIGGWFFDEGVRQITVSSVDMAYYFAGAGWQDITVAFPINLRQMSSLIDLSGKVHLHVLIENRAALIALGDSHIKVNVWIKIDSGLNRTGILFDEYASIQNLITEAEKYPGIHVEGLLTHAGQTYTAKSKEEVIRKHLESTNHLIELRNNLNLSGLKISIGDTPGCSLVSQFSGIDEIRPGNFVFYDAEQLEIGSCSMEQISVVLACPVVSVHSERNEVVLYGGAIHMSKETYLHNGELSFGIAVNQTYNGWNKLLPGCFVSKTSQEHGILKVPDEFFHLFPVGSLAYIIPAHSCLTAHLMRRYKTLDGRIIDMMPI